MFRRTADEQSSIDRAVREVEEAVGAMRGRKFYGTFVPDGSEYRFCVGLVEGDVPASLGLEAGALPGGRYARVRLEGDPPALYERIAPAFEQLAQRPDRDPSRPGIEFYRRRDVVDLLLPVR